MERYETPGALRHDARALAEDVRSLLAATAQMTDQKIGEARKRIGDAIEQGKVTCENLQEKTLQTAKLADDAVRSHPYEAITMAFGAGMLLGLLLLRTRD